MTAALLHWLLDAVEVQLGTSNLLQLPLAARHAQHTAALVSAKSYILRPDIQIV